MKHFAFTLFFMSLISLLNAQDTNLIGDWNIIEFSMTNNGNVNKMTEQQLNDNKSVWDLYLMEDGTLQQTSNMRNGESETQTGTWISNEGNLILNLKINEREFPIQYAYELAGDILTVKRSNPMGTMNIETKFRKKN